MVEAAAVGAGDDVDVDPTAADSTATGGVTAPSVPAGAAGPAATIGT